MLPLIRWNRNPLRRLEQSASRTADPLERLRFLRQRVTLLSLPAPRRRRLSLPGSPTAVALAAALTLAFLIWRSI